MWINKKTFLEIIFRPMTDKRKFPLKIWENQSRYHRKSVPLRNRQYWSMIQSPALPPERDSWEFRWLNKLGRERSTSIGSCFLAWLCCPLPRWPDWAYLKCLLKRWFFESLGCDSACLDVFCLSGFLANLAANAYLSWFDSSSCTSSRADTRSLDLGVFFLNRV